MHPIFRFKTDAMRQLLNLTSRGYIFWTSGRITPKKCPALIYKFRDRYDIDATHQQRYRAKKKGLCITTLILWQEDPDTIHWWLLTTEGEGLIKSDPIMSAVSIHHYSPALYVIIRPPCLVCVFGSASITRPGASLASERGGRRSHSRGSNEKK